MLINSSSSDWATFVPKSLEKWKKLVVIEFGLICLVRPNK